MNPVYQQYELDFYKIIIDKLEKDITNNTSKLISIYQRILNLEKEHLVLEKRKEILVDKQYMLLSNIVSNPNFKKN